VAAWVRWWRKRARDDRALPLLSLSRKKKVREKAEAVRATRAGPGGGEKEVGPPGGRGEMG
jgi:hypothetical protein